MHNVVNKAAWWHLLLLAQERSRKQPLQGRFMQLGQNDFVNFQFGHKIVIFGNYNIRLIIFLFGNKLLVSIMFNYIAYTFLV